MEKNTVKIGTNVILNERLGVNKKQIFNIAKQIAELSKKGYFFYIISSGAIGFGKKTLKQKQGSALLATDVEVRPLHNGILATVGQVELISCYKEIFAQFNLKMAQLLLARDMFADRKKCENLKVFLKELCEKNIIPIINEYDPLIFGEQSFGDNDSLAAAVAVLTDSSKLILLSTVDGIYRAEDSNEVIKVIENANKEIEKRFCFQKTSKFGRGGMLSKLRAAKLASSAGIETFVINGLKENSIKDLLSGKKIGTKIISLKNNLSEKQKWMLIRGFSGSKLVIDEGAKQAILQRKSLLAVGIRKVSGKFDEKDYVDICDLSGDLIGIGMVNYPFEKLEILNKSPHLWVGYLKRCGDKIKDRNCIKKVFQKEVIHSNNLILV